MVLWWLRNGFLHFGKLAVDVTGNISRMPSRFSSTLEGSTRSTHFTPVELKLFVYHIQSLLRFFE